MPTSGKYITEDVAEALVFDPADKIAKLTRVRDTNISGFALENNQGGIKTYRFDRRKQIAGVKRGAYVTLGHHPDRDGLPNEAMRMIALACNQLWEKHGENWFELPKDEVKARFNHFVHSLRATLVLFFSDTNKLVASSSLNPRYAHRQKNMLKE